MYSSITGYWGKACMRVLYHFPHINGHQNIYSVPQWNRVKACVLAHACDAGVGCCWQKNQEFRVIQPGLTKKKDKEGTGTEDLSLVLSTCIRQLKPPVNQSLKDPNPLTSTATYTNVASFTHKIFLIFLMVGLPIPNSMVFNSLYLVVLKWFLMFFFVESIIPYTHISSAFIFVTQIE